MRKTILAISWIVFSTWWSYRTRPLEPLILPILVPIAHPGNLSTVYPDRMDQLQALFHTKPPLIQAKGLQIPQNKKSLLIPARPQSTMHIQDLFFITDGSGPILSFEPTTSIP